jgi:peptidoglycan/xylan/chitin deacetylase (PgdA/CDA1 family)
MLHGVGRVTADPFDLFLSPERFAGQMRVLARSGLRGVSLAELRAAESRGRAQGLVGLTFDDAYRDVLDWAPPVLAGHGFTATVFAVSDLLGGENTWDPPPRRRLMDADDLRRLADQGWEVGSHGATHVRLAGLDADGLRREVAGSRQALARVTGVPPATFCYPYGSVDAAAVEAVRAAGYVSACAVSPPPGLDRELASPRIGIAERDHPLRFAARLGRHGRRAP